MDEMETLDIKEENGFPFIDSLSKEIAADEIMKLITEFVNQNYEPKK